MVINSFISNFLLTPRADGRGLFLCGRLTPAAQCPQDLPASYPMARMMCFDGPFEILLPLIDADAATLSGFCHMGHFAPRVAPKKANRKFPV